VWVILLCGGGGGRGGGGEGGGGGGGGGGGAMDRLNARCGAPCSEPCVSSTHKKDSTVPPLSNMSAKVERRWSTVSSIVCQLSGHFLLHLLIVKKFKYIHTHISSQNVFLCERRAAFL